MRPTLGGSTLASAMGRIIYYNAIKTEAYLRTGRYADVIEPFLVAAPDLEQRKRTYLRFFEVLNTRPYFDRTGACPSFLDVELLFPIPEPSPTPTFGELCLARAVELLTLDKPIKLFWSGGIDSTCALVALLMSRAPFDQLEVIYDEHSIEEYPWFFREVVRKRLRHRRVPRGALSLELSPEAVGTTGEPADQLFGNLNKFLTRIGWDKAFSPWQGLFPDDLVELCAPIVARAPVAIETLDDYLWWMNFVLKYQQTSLRLLANIQGQSDLSRSLAGMHPFYGTEAFQRWSLSRAEPRSGDTFESFKLPAKRLIFEYTRDAEYLANKVKVGSLQANRDPDWLFLLADGTVVYPSEEDQRVGPSAAELALR